jgi:hypothetical protein
MSVYNSRAVLPVFERKIGDVKMKMFLYFCPRCFVSCFALPSTIFLRGFSRLSELLIS